MNPYLDSNNINSYKIDENSKNDFQNENQQINNNHNLQINNINPNFINNYAINYSKSNNINNNNSSNQELSSEDIDKIIRIGFIRKVYGVLLVQLIITFGICCLSFIEKIRDFVSSHTLIYYLVAIVAFILIIILSCFKKVAKKVPINYILLFVWTLCEGYLLLTLCSYYSFKIVLMALGLTVGITVGLTIYACKTKTDFTMCGGLLFCFLIGFIFFGLFGFWFGKWVYTLYCFLGVLLFSVYLIYDTQLVLKKFGVGYDIDDYVFAALSIYIDIINIFIYILSLLGSNN